MLFLVESKRGLEGCKRQVSMGDVVAFTGDGVLYAEAINNCSCYAVIDDVQRCGVDLPDKVEACDYSQILDFVCKESSSITCH